MDDKLVRLSDVEQWILTESACIDTPADRDDVVDRMRYSIPAVDAVEVRHGEWIACGETRTVKIKDDYDVPDQFKFHFPDDERTERLYKCSFCGLQFMIDCFTLYYYCPHCGARMDGQRREEEHNAVD